MKLQNVVFYRFSFTWTNYVCLYARFYSQPTDLQALLQIFYVPEIVSGSSKNTAQQNQQIHDTDKNIKTAWSHHDTITIETFAGQ